jgi:hypothetical protein
MLDEENIIKILNYLRVNGLLDRALLDTLVDRLLQMRVRDQGELASAPMTALPAPDGEF